MVEREEGQDTLERLLDRAQSALRTAILAELLLGAIAIVLVALALGTGSVALGVDPRFASGIALLGCIASTLGLGVRAFLRWRHHAKHPFAVARWLDGRAEVVGRKRAVALLDAAELRRDLGDQGESPKLKRAAILSATQFAEDQDLGEAVARETRQTTTRFVAVITALMGLNAVLALVDHDAYGRVLSAFMTSEGLEAVLVPTAPEPRLGDIRLTYRYPEYTGRRPKSVVSASGLVRAVPGTRVTVETMTRRALRSGVMVLNYGDAEDSPRISAEVVGRTLRAQFVVSRGGRYRFELTDEQGTRLEERRGHEIRLEVDEPPQVTLLVPEESPLEVNERDRVKIAFKASDDFELGKARIAWRVLGTTREGTQPLTDDTVGRKRYAGRGRFKLRALKLSPGDRVAYSVEVFDNDTIGGPKVGASKTMELRVYSKKAHHERVMNLELEALDGLVHLLGDNLEKPFPDPAKEAVDATLDLALGVLDKANDVRDKLDAAAKAIEDDPLGRENVGDAFAQASRELQRRAGSMRRAQITVLNLSARPRTPKGPALRTLGRQQSLIIDTLERQSVYLSDLIDDQRMMDAESLAKDLRAQQQALREALQEYKDAPTPEKREAIAKAIQDIQKRIREIMSEIAKLQTQIPQDFVNADAMQQDSESMEGIQKLIEDGDLDGAMRDLDRMLGQTERMLSQLQEGREELQTREYSEITQRAEKVWNDLEEVQQRQRDLAERTQKIADEVQARSKERMGDASEFVKAQLEKLEKAARALETARPERHMPDAELFELTERRIKDGREALENQDFGASQEVLQKSVGQLDNIDREARRREEQAERFGDVFDLSKRAKKTRDAVKAAKPEVESVLKAIDDLAPDPSDLLNPAEKSQLQRFQDEQKALAEKAQQIEQELEALGEQLPIVGPEVRSAMGEAKSAMGKSGEQLGSGDAPGAAGQERRAVEALERVSKQLEEMGSQSGGGQGGTGVPLPFGQPSGRDNENERGGRGRFNRDKVEIPKPETYRAPSEFREDILEAAKQGTVESYRDAVRRYYEELVK